MLTEKIMWCSVYSHVIYIIDVDMNGWIDAHKEHVKLSKQNKVSVNLT